MSASASPASALVPGTPGESQWVRFISYAAVDPRTKLTFQREYKSADGRVYWSHALTKQSVWEKPDELKVR